MPESCRLAQTGRHSCLLVTQRVAGVGGLLRAFVFRIAPKAQNGTRFVTTSIHIAQRVAGALFTFLVMTDWTGELVVPTTYLAR